MKNTHKLLKRMGLVPSRSQLLEQVWTTLCTVAIVLLAFAIVAAWTNG